MTLADPPSLAAIRRRSNAAVFPTDLLPGQTSALLLFCAGFLGANDGIHVWDAEIPNVTGVDLDADLLGLMRTLYPGWDLIEADVYEWSQAIFAAFDPHPRPGVTMITTALRPRWDIVILDPQVNQAERCYQLLPLWCSLAVNAVVLGVMRATIVRDDLHRLDCRMLPPGWYLDRVTARNDTAHWLVARPDTHHPPKPHQEQR